MELLEGNHCPLPEELDSKNATTDVYSVAAKYWSEIPATVDGMLGGFGFISITDIKGSEHFVKQLLSMKRPPGRRRAVDCGAGIGRISKNLLIPLFDEVDLVEQDKAFIDKACGFIGPTKKKVNFHNLGLQRFKPVASTYDLIWCQWVLGHLPDDDLIEFFKACITGLKPNGVIVVKENLTSSQVVETDATDSSVTRPLHLLKELFTQSGLKCIKEQKQNNFPRGLYEVRMFALRPVALPEPASVEIPEPEVSIEEPESNVMPAAAAD